jgi:hypothetical protein
MSRQVLAPLRAAEGRPVLDREGAALARERNEEVREAIARRGYRLVGTLDDLPVREPTDVPDQVTPPPTADVVRAAEAVRAYAAGLVTRRSETGTPPPDTALDERVAEGARLLRKAHGWGL